jgi:hypothetical protein
MKRKGTDMNPGNGSDEMVVTVSRKMFFALCALAWFSVFGMAGVTSGFAQRAGAEPGLANGLAFGLAFVLMYPYFALRTEMTRAGTKPTPPFWKFALHGLVAFVVVNVVVTRAITHFFP